MFSPVRRAFRRRLIWLCVNLGTAFLAAQLLDVAIFDRLRRGSWWRAPLVSTLISSSLDTVIFFSLAFAAAFWVTVSGLGLANAAAGTAALALSWALVRGRPGGQPSGAESRIAAQRSG